MLARHGGDDHDYNEAHEHGQAAEEREEGVYSLGADALASPLRKRHYEYSRRSTIRRVMHVQSHAGGHSNSITYSNTNDLYQHCAAVNRGCSTAQHSATINTLLP